LSSYFSFEPTIEGFEKSSDSRTFSKENRNVLVNVLYNQYNHIQDNNQQLVHIDSLLNENTFTVTTGHQLCLFTGPLYFIYKILSVVKLSKQLKQKFPDKNFVPIYWMASEDHDFEEINHFYLHNQRLDCITTSSDAVGNIIPEYGEMFNQFKEELGKGKLAKELYEIFINAYSNTNLADATFKLVHSLLGEYGIVILNPDNKELKEVFSPYLKKEIEEQVSFNEVAKSTNELQSLKFKTQVNPRDINLFYLADDSRVRIEKSSEGYKLSDNSKKWSFEEILIELEQFPGKFSPNVILRPLYQEVILPNLSYTGGAGELSYWFQLKGMFDKFKVDFPILMLRNSAIVLSKKNQVRLDKLGIEVSHLFSEITELEALILRKHGSNQIDLEEGRQDIEDLMDKVKQLAIKVSPALSVTVDATTTKSLKLLNKLEKKLVRNEKINIKIVLDQLYLVLEEVFPNGTFQERRTNFSEIYLDKGKMFFKEVYDQFNPLEMNITVLKG